MWLHIHSSLPTRVRFLHSWAVPNAVIGEFGMRTRTYNNGKFGMRSRTYPREASGPFGPGLRVCACWTEPPSLKVRTKTLLLTPVFYTRVFDNEFEFCITARSVEDESRNGHRNAKWNPNWNQETSVIGFFSNFQMKRDLEQQFYHSD